MRLAINEAKKNTKIMDGGPFGACIVKEDKVLATCRNTVLISDATAHAEINAIRLASKKINSFDLSGTVIYSTTEPCPMCFAAIHWAKIGQIVYGTGIRDAKKIGFNELPISLAIMKKMGKSQIKVRKNFLYGECCQLLTEWSRQENKELY